MGVVVAVVKGVVVANGVVVLRSTLVVDLVVVGVGRCMHLQADAMYELAFDLRADGHPLGTFFCAG